MARPPLTAPILGDPSRSDADPYDLHSDLIREEPEILGLEDHLDEMDAILARLGTSLDEGQLSQADSDHGHLSGQVIMALDLHESWSDYLRRVFSTVTSWRSGVTRCGNTADVPPTLKELTATRSITSLSVTCSK